jgi:hypothetical protein
MIDGNDPAAALQAASRSAGLDATGAKLIRAAENTLYRLPGHIVARVTRPGQGKTAAKEVQVSRWLRQAGLRVVETLPDIKQPVEVNGRAVTFWRELPEHRKGTPTEIAHVLRRLHALPAPPFDLPKLAPFVRLAERISGAKSLAPGDRSWLLGHLAELEQRYERLPAGLPSCAIHGDAWGGNLAVTADEVILLDLERFAYGPPEWDLTSTAVNHTTFGYVTADQWREFCRSYGHDVTTWSGFEVLRDIRELRKVTFAAQVATERPEFIEQARYRLACIRGDHGVRPWNWQGLP